MKVATHNKLENIQNLIKKGEKESIYVILKIFNLTINNKKEK